MSSFFTSSTSSGLVVPTAGQLAGDDVDAPGRRRARRPPRPRPTGRCRPRATPAGSRRRRSGPREPPSVGTSSMPRRVTGRAGRASPRAGGRASGRRRQVGLDHVQRARAVPPAARRCRRAPARRTRRAARRPGAPSGCRSPRRAQRPAASAAPVRRATSTPKPSSPRKMLPTQATRTRVIRRRPRREAGAARPRRARSRGSGRAPVLRSAPGSSSTVTARWCLPSTSCSTAATVAV